MPHASAKPLVRSPESGAQNLDNMLSQWRAEGSRRVRTHHQVFRTLVSQTEELVRSGDHASAAVQAELAALYAIWRHPGLFASGELERLLLTIGENTVCARDAARPRKVSRGWPIHVLHVSTRVMSVGGHTRMLWRWIQQDSGRVHSVALTRQLREIPAALRDAVAGTGGRIYRVNRAVGGLISWARQLRNVAMSADLVVLHSFNDDAIPLLAFAREEGLPPVLFLDHADHIFWLGAAISDAVISLRESGMRIARERRGFAPDRTVLLPTILAPTRRSLSRRAAKRSLGLPEDSVLLVSVARGLKYGRIGERSYADAHIPVLERHRNAWLLIVGAGNRPDWTDAMRHVQGRILPVAECDDPWTYHQAADMYVDSFPFVSTTSLLEAGRLGTALISLFPYSDASRILGADAPGLSGTLLTAQDAGQYESILSHLIEDESFRHETGEAARRQIEELHVEGAWLRRLTEVYAFAASLPPARARSVGRDEICVGEPDVYIPWVHGATDPSVSAGRDLDRVLETLLRVMPPRRRLLEWSRRAWRSEGFDHASRAAALKYLVPEWLVARLRSDPWIGA